MSILIETARLQMRHFTLKDIDAVYEFSVCPETSRFTGDAGCVKNKDDAEKIIREIWLEEYEKYGYARYALIHKGDQKIIGFCGVKFEPSLGYPDIGYRMLPDYWGKGLGTEAAAAVVNYARDTLGIKKLVGEVVDKNIASNKLLLKLGFSHVDTYQKDGFTIYRYESHAVAQT